MPLPSPSSLAASGFPYAVLVLLMLFPPPPRPQTAKVYVQTRLAENAVSVYEHLFLQGGWLVVAGSAKRMPADVVAAVQTVRLGQGGS